MSDALPSPATRWIPPRGDVLLAAGLLLSGILSSWLGLVAGFYQGEAAGLGTALVYSVALSAPLAFRRRFPTLCLVIVAAVFYAGGSLRVSDLYVGQIALFIAFYGVGAWVLDRRRAVVIRALVTVGMFVWLLATLYLDTADPDPDGPSMAGAFSPFAAYALIQILVNMAFFAGAWYMGDRAYASALQRGALEERTAELEREREVTAAQAVALDRVRIARELHDVVAHHVSAMGVQAGAARAVIEKDPDAARTALAGVETSARSALHELRQLLETLRTPDGGSTEGSTLSVEDLHDLVAYADENGLPTTYAVIGDPRPLPDVVQVNLYRIAQEALTNARRHAGPDARADVRLRFERDGVELEITNTGRVATPMRPGLGLVGMRERAAASGGTLEAGPRVRGGFRVRVHVPLPAAPPAAPRDDAAVTTGAIR